METPVAFFIFNRPQHTAKSFSSIRSIAPKYLYVIADGPRPDIVDDVENVKQARAVVKNVNWSCNVSYNFADTNLGLKRRVVSGLNWVFRQADSAIILEDDCVPGKDFFRFSESMLQRYQYESDILGINGNNVQYGRQRGDGSYYFSKYMHCSGWATWQRAWQYFDENMTFWPLWKSSSVFADRVPDAVERAYWTKVFDNAHAHGVDSWAYPWLCSIWYNNGRVITPNVNLVENIGFDEMATHTKSKRHPQAGLSSAPLSEIHAPSEVGFHIEADKFTFDNHFGGKKLRFPMVVLVAVYRTIKKIWKRSQ